MLKKCADFIAEKVLRALISFLNCNNLDNYWGSKGKNLKGISICKYMVTQVILLFKNCVIKLGQIQMWLMLNWLLIEREHFQLSNLQLCETYCILGFVLFWTLRYLYWPERLKLRNVHVLFTVQYSDLYYSDIIVIYSDLTFIIFIMM